MKVVDRAKNILFRPNAAWVAIDKEFTDPGTIYKSYVIPLAAIGPVCSLIGMSLFGFRVPFIGAIRVPFSSALTQTAVSYVLALVAVYVFALIINALAPSFGGQQNQVQALKAAAYSSTAAWVAGVFNLYPALSALGLLVSLYSLYLLYAGLPVVMKTPRDRAMGYTVVVIIVAVVIGVLLTAIRTAFIPTPR